MTDYEISDFVDVSAKAKELNCNIPSGITVLPQNFHSGQSYSELYYESIALDLRAAFRENGIQGTSLEKSEEVAVKILIRECALPEWSPPIIYVVGKFIQENPALVDFMLNILSNFFYDKYKSVFMREPTSTDTTEFYVVKLSIGSLTYKKAKYRGSWEGKKLKGLKEFGDIVRKL